MSDQNNDADDLEKTLMLAAADADARNNETQRVSVIKKASSNTPEESLEKPSDSREIAKSEEKIDEEPPKKKAKTEGPKQDAKTAQSGSVSSVVAQHYNKLEEKGLEERSRSRIVYMRNFHNWIKSMLISENLNIVKDLRRYNVPIRVLDMCCGKGGDLLKWRKGGIQHLICSDIAEVSLEQCKSRYNEMKHRRERAPGQLFSVEFIAGDSTRMRLREKYKDPSMKLDLVSCQFAFHYSFESLPQAECMMRNASECLQPGGFFIGTMPDANELISRMRKNEGKEIKNDVFHVTFDCDVYKPPLFGAKYNFQLDGVVNCPEFLVHFPTFAELAKKYGLKLVRKEKFIDFYKRMLPEGRNLLSTMKSLETYPPIGPLVGSASHDYKHAKEYLDVQDYSGNHCKIGTLSKSEWEASSLYLTFVFEKVKHTWNADGTPKYEF